LIVIARRFALVNHKKEPLPYEMSLSSVFSVKVDVRLLAEVPNLFRQDPSGTFFEVFLQLPDNSWVWWPVTMEDLNNMRKLYLRATGSQPQHIPNPFSSPSSCQASTSPMPWQDDSASSSSLDFHTNDMPLSLPSPQQCSFAISAPSFIPKRKRSTIEQQQQQQLVSGWEAFRTSKYLEYKKDPTKLQAICQWFFKNKHKGQKLPQNERDALLTSIKEGKQRESFQLIGQILSAYISDEWRNTSDAQRNFYAQIVFNARQNGQVLRVKRAKKRPRNLKN
jgi:hypothetical protein